MAWVKVRNYHAAGEQTLAEAKPAVKAKLIQDKAFAAAKAEVQTALNEFKTKPAASVAKGKLVFEDASIHAQKVCLSVMYNVQHLAYQRLKQVTGQ